MVDMLIILIAAKAQETIPLALLRIRAEAHAPMLDIRGRTESAHTRGYHRH